MQDLKAYVRARVPLRASLIGKAGLDELVHDAVAEWPISALWDCGADVGARRRLLDGLAARVRERRQRYGFIWTLLLGSVLSAVIRIMLEWWLSKAANRVKMAGWQCDMRGEK